MQETAIKPPVIPIPHRENLSSNRLHHHWGYLILGASASLFVLTEFLDFHSRNEDLSVFFAHYLLALLYAGILIYNRSLGVVKSWRRTHIHSTMILLNIFLVSCYALNRDLPVFQESTLWFCFYLVTCSATGLSLAYFKHLPKAIVKLQYFIAGSSLILYLYLSLYVSNYYAIGGIGILALGIGGHVLVPLFLLIGTIALLKHSRNKQVSSLSWVLAGSMSTCLFVLWFIVSWNKRISTIETMGNKSVLTPAAELPFWVVVAKSVPNDWITSRILKSDLVFTINHGIDSWGLFPSRSWNENLQHDPLVYIASTTRKSSLSEDERINILKTLSGSRHEAEDQLWSGENLVTSYIVTDADIFSELRLAYTENYFNIRNDLRPHSRRRDSQEAIYTFQLPEGSVVTSLSLWINGKEEKAILTSKQKARTAYHTIVGVEQRDPSVVHWQEGNTVTVRIFPCMPTEERKFKIGVTSPLTYENGTARYEGISFRGPSALHAKQTVRLRFIGSISQLNISNSFDKNENGEYIIGEQTYDPDFSVSFKSEKLAENQFSFQGFSYCLSEFQAQMIPTKFDALYLDINNSWANEEIERFRSLAATRATYVYINGEFIQLNSSNWHVAINKLSGDNFSIFPFHLLRKPSSSLVITKGNETSPFLADFRNSDFAKSLTDFFKSGNRVHIFNISSQVSTYIRSLKELRAIQFSKGSTEQLLDMLDKNLFPVFSETDERLHLDNANMVITKVASPFAHKKDTAPDHLARLYAYNNIMRQVGKHYFENDFVNDQLVAEASNAYVVSPVSSLIVLETKEDYARFGITGTENSLGNASKQSSGAVPEPHEWALIILSGALVCFCIARIRARKSILVP